MSTDRTHAPDVTVGQPTALSTEPLPTVPGYQLVREISRGGTGSVYEARQDGLGRTVALKIVRGDNPKAFTRLHAHADAVAAVCHPNVVQIYDYAEHDGQAILTLEFVAGGTLTEHLQDVGRMTGRPAATLIIGVARGVAAAHAHQIVHGELKPGNILLDDAGEPKIADFGFERCVFGPDGGVMGQPAYVAPELVSGATKFIGPAVDIWSIGVILYQCITGRRPFQADNSLDLLHAIGHRSPERPTQLVPELSRDLEFVCLKCLAKNPSHRYHSVAEVADDLTRFLAGEPVHARVHTPAEKLARWARRNKLVALVSAATLVTAVAGFVGSIWMWQRTEKLLTASQAALAHEEHQHADAMASRAQSEHARVTEKKRADDALAALQTADRNAQELAGTAADLIALTFAKGQPPTDPNTRKTLLDALAVCRRGVASPLTTPQMQVRFSVAFVQIGDWLEAQGSVAEAADLYREAVELARPAATADPKDRQAVSQLAASLAHRGAAVARLGKASDAVPLLIEAEKHDRLGMTAADAADRPFWKSNLCLHLETLAEVYRVMGRRGDADRTLQDAKGLVQNVDQMRLIAGGFALLAASIPEPPSAEEAKEKERYLTDAIETLRLAVDGGWRFPSARSYKPSTLDNADFRPFKDHPDVKKLLAEAAKK
ncbi:MAG: hypothetical protein C0467_22180 [Planctomycetaceae bacterium]|nr:hypothetical protein [Planctomycetaceae bacterium]